MRERKTLSETILKRFKDNIAGALVITMATVIIGFAAFYKSIWEIFETTSKLKKNFGLSSPGSPKGVDSSLPGTASPAQNAAITRLTINDLDLFRMTQSEPHWGLAPAVATIVKRHGIDVKEVDFASRLRASAIPTLESLSGIYKTTGGTEFSLSFVRIPSPTGVTLKRFLELHTPLLFRQQSHFYVLTGIDFIQTGTDDVIITQLHLIDEGSLSAPQISRSPAMLTDCDIFQIFVSEL